MNKVYYFVDESGQHTQGDFFTVAVVIVRGSGLRDKVEQELLRVEKKVRKGTLKWTKTNYEKKQNYLRSVINIVGLENSFFYSIYFDTQDYVQSTVDTVTKSIQQQVTSMGKCESVVIVDGLNKAEKQHFARKLRKKGVVDGKVRGAKDENNAWIRLADAIAGFSRDFQEKKPYTQDLYDKMQKRHLIRLEK